MRNIVTPNGDIRNPWRGFPRLGLDILPIWGLSYPHPAVLRDSEMGQQQENLHRHSGARIADRLILGLSLGILATALVPVVGCAVNAAAAPDDFPKLAVSVHRVPHKEWFAKCSFAFGRGVLPDDCVFIFWATRRCEVWLSQDFESKTSEAHGRGHCKGQDHYGDSTVANGWAAWKAKQSTAARE